MPAESDADRLTATDRLGPLLAEALGDERWRECHAQLISGGKSNLTFEISSAAGSVILRRPPTGTLLPRAHDMLREARVQRDLATTAVPVAPILLTDGGELLGVPCYVMGKVEGHIIRDELPREYAGQPGAPRRLTDALVDTLAAIHGLDPDVAGLGDFGRPAGALERQVRLWTKQWERARTQDEPAVDELARRLAANIPATQRDSLVHGDFRIDNCVFDQHDPGLLSAVLDWEMSTLGDPLTDLAILLYVWRQPGERLISLVPSLTAQGGWPDRSYLTTRYAEATGLDLADLPFYLGLAHLKFASISQGIAARVQAGSMAGQDFGDLREEIRVTAEEGLAALEGRT